MKCKLAWRKLDVIVNEKDIKCFYPMEFLCWRLGDNAIRKICLKKDKIIGMSPDVVALSTNSATSLQKCYKKELCECHFQNRQWSTF